MLFWPFSLWEMTIRHLTAHLRVFLGGRCTPGLWFCFWTSGKRKESLFSPSNFDWSIWDILLLRTIKFCSRTIKLSEKLQEDTEQLPCVAVRVLAEIFHIRTSNKQIRTINTCQQQCVCPPSHSTDTKIYITHSQVSASVTSIVNNCHSPSVVLSTFMLRSHMHGRMWSCTVTSVTCLQKCAVLQCVWGVRVSSHTLDHHLNTDAVSRCVGIRSADPWWWCGVYCSALQVAACLNSTWRQCEF